MKVGIIATTNTKGQLVIPKELRDILGISPKTPVNLVLRGNGIYVYPIKSVIGTVEAETSYSKILERTQGAWREDTFDQTRKKRRKIELKASEERKKGW